MIPCMRSAPATVADYQRWLVAHRKSGNEPTHHYDYPFAQGNLAHLGSGPDFRKPKWYVAERNFRAVPLFGAAAVNIIVPKGVNFLGGNLGHSTLFFEADGRTDGHCVPSYTDAR